MHKNKFFWKHVHSKHHEMKNLTVWATSYAEFFENVLMIAPPIVIIQLAYLNLFDTYYSKSFVVALLNQILIFKIGHSGFYQNFWVVLACPGLIVGIALRALGLEGQVTTDHEMHHLFPLNNFALNFRVWDRLMGSYKPILHLEKMKEKKEGLQPKAE
jgi:sterol desaturase/sphingolipid hydroxylase (fatty acid hydroxylase superfamily)